MLATPPTGRSATNAPSEVLQIQIMPATSILWFVKAVRLEVTVRARVHLLALHVGKDGMARRSERHRRMMDVLSAHETPFRIKILRLLKMTASSARKERLLNQDLQVVLLTIVKLEVISIQGLESANIVLQAPRTPKLEPQVLKAAHLAGEESMPLRDRLRANFVLPEDTTIKIEPAAVHPVKVALYNQQMVRRVATVARQELMQMKRELLALNVELDITILKLNN